MPTTPLSALRYPSLTDPANGPQAFQNLATDLDNRTVMRFASAAARDAAITAPVAGMLAWLDDVDQHTFHDGTAWRIGTQGAWTAYTPTWTDLTIGNGTQTCRYIRLGQTVHLTLRVSFGSTTTLTANNATLTLPVPAVTDPIGQGTCRGYDQSAGGYTSGVALIASATTAVFLLPSLSTNANLSWVRATWPWTWAASDGLWATLTYEAA